MGRAILQEGRTRAAVQRNVALMNGNPYAYWEQRGISLHLMPWGAVACIRFSRRAMDRWGGVQSGRMFDEIKSFL